MFLNLRERERQLATSYEGNYRGGFYPGRGIHCLSHLVPGVTQSSSQPQPRSNFSSLKGVTLTEQPLELELGLQATFSFVHGHIGVTLRTLRCILF